MSLPRRRTRLALVAALALGSSAGARAQAEPRGTSIVIVTGQQATTPVPTLMEGAANSVGNLDVVDQLFLRLVELGPKLVTSGDRDFVPGLARSWSRRDSTTLVFDLDPRARWHDGVPVTARDVVFTFGRARNPDISPRVSDLLRQITSVTAEGDSRVVFRFARPYAEQLYDATYHVAPHSGPPAGFHSARFGGSLELRYQPDRQRPVSVGTQRAGAVRGAGGGFPTSSWASRRSSGSSSALPPSRTARINLLLGGQADAMDVISATVRRADCGRHRASAHLGAVLDHGVSPLQPARSQEPGPASSDPGRQQGAPRDYPGARSPARWFRRCSAPRAGAVWAGLPDAVDPPRSLPSPSGPDMPEARRLLAAAAGATPMATARSTATAGRSRLSLSLPNTSAIRRQMSLLIQEQLRRHRRAGRAAAIEFPIWIERRTAGDFDIDFAAAEPGPLALRTDPELDLHRRQQRRRILRSAGGFADASRRCWAQGDPAQHWAGASADRGGRAGHLPVRAHLHVRGEPALSEREPSARQSSWLLLREVVGRPRHPPPPSH